MTGVLAQRGNLNTDMPTWKIPAEHESRDRGDASTSQVIPRTASKPPEDREAWDGFSLSAPEGTNPADTLIMEWETIISII